MSVGLQIGPECVSGCGARASATAAQGSGAAVDGLAGKTIPVPGDSEGSFQSSWHQFLQALGLRTSEGPGEGKEIGAVSVPSFVKPAPGQALTSLPPASQSNAKAGDRVVAPRASPRVRTDFPAGKKAAGAGSKAAAQAHDSRKGDGASTTSAAAAGGQAPAWGLQLIAVSAPAVAASRSALPPAGPGVRNESFASEFPVARPGRLAASAVDREANSKGSIAALASERMEANSENGPADATGGELLNGKGPAAASVEDPKPGSTEAAGNRGWQEPGQDLNDSLHAVGPAHAATGAAIANAAVPTSTDSQLTVNAAPPALHRSGLKIERAVEPSLVRGAERPAHIRAGGDAAGQRGFSMVAAQEAAVPILARAPAGVTEASGRPGGWVDAAHAAGKESNALTGEETFARLDAESPSQSIHWVQAGAHRAEAGYLDPNLGWVGVRAETSGGGVHAALLPGSPEAAQVLGTHLSGLNAFLAQQHGPHATATMAAPEDGRSGVGAQQGNSAGGGGGRDDGPGRNMAPAGSASDSSPQTAASAVGAVDRSIGSDGSAIRRAGTYVSVMA
jgi:hypothetical protein